MNRFIINSAALCGTIAILIGVCSCSQSTEIQEQSADSVDIALLTTYEDSLSYYIGANHGINIASTYKNTDPLPSYDFDTKAFMQGLRDVVLADTTPLGFHEGLKAGLSATEYLNNMHAEGVILNRQNLVDNFSAVIRGDTLTESEVTEAMDTYDHLMGLANNFLLKKFRESRKLKALQREKEAKINAASGEKYLNAIKATDTKYITTSSGIVFQIIKQGDGEKPSLDNNVQIIYTGCFTDGNIFNSSEGESVEFRLQDLVIGLQEGIMLMPVGSKYRIIIPPTLGYGNDQHTPSEIGPNRTLIFDVELTGIK